MSQANPSRAARRRPGGITLPPHRREQLVREVHARGEPLVLRVCGISRQGLARAAAGLGVRPGTVALIERGLDRLAAEARERADRGLAGAEGLLSRRGMP